VIGVMLKGLAESRRVFGANLGDSGRIELNNSLVTRGLVVMKELSKDERDDPDTNSCQ